MSVTMDVILEASGRPEKLRLNRLCAVRELLL